MAGMWGRRDGCLGGLSTIRVMPFNSWRPFPASLVRGKAFMAHINVACATGAVHSTIQTTIRLSTLLSLTVLLSACDGRRSVSPTPPTAGVVTPSSVTYTLSGVVTETGSM